MAKRALLGAIVVLIGTASSARFDASSRFASPLATQRGSLLDGSSMRRDSFLEVSGVTSGTGRAGLSLRREERKILTLQYALRGGGEAEADSERGAAEKVPGIESIEHRVNQPIADGSSRYLSQNECSLIQILDVPGRLWMRALHEPWRKRRSCATRV